MHPNLGECISKAYEKSLKKYHGWFIQKMFGVSLCFEYWKLCHSCKILLDRDNIFIHCIVENIFINK